MNPSVTIINDCSDDNAKTKQTTRCASLFNSPVNYLAVKSDLEASGNLIDVLDAFEDRPGLLLVNVAPRNANAKRWPNGTPFGYFYHNRVLIVSTIDGLTLSLVKKMKLTDEVYVMDIPTALTEMMEKNFLNKNLKEHIINTQFRSYNFVPRVAAYLYKYKTISHEKMSIEEVADPPKTYWWVDNFGNCKTTLFQNEVEVKNGKIKTKDGNFDFKTGLKDVSDDQSAFIVGSSGLKKRNFVELVVQGKKASERFKIQSGDQIF